MPSREYGAATVEHAGLALLIGLLVVAGVAALAAGPSPGGRDLGFALARKLRCAAQGPGPCWRDPLTEAYGRAVGGAVRALAPAPVAKPGPGGRGLLPVDFRHCRTPRCAAPGPRSPALTASNRRTTAFVSVADRRRVEGSVRITYWLYRPTLGWEAIARRLSPAEIAAHAATPLLDTAIPALVALETLPGRNHYQFPAGEEPPWRWRVEPAVPDPID
ncbi:MAG: hypothetical protein ACRDKX_04900 [Solirubrobacterales bacterium]